jgi:hypothetical protein
MSPIKLPLAGKTALVTGGIRGIGRGISLELARRGANVAMVYANPSRQDTAMEVVKEIQSLESGVKAVSIQADLKKFDNYQKIVDETLKEFHVKNIDIVGMYKSTGICKAVFDKLTTIQNGSSQCGLCFTYFNGRYDGTGFRRHHGHQHSSAILSHPDVAPVHSSGRARDPHFIHCG